MVKRLFLIFLLSYLFFLFSLCTVKDEFVLNNYSKDYFIRNGYLKTGSKNLVTSIYLDFRLFDSIFESSLLLVTIAGIIHISKRDDVQ